MRSKKSSSQVTFQGIEDGFDELFCDLRRNLRRVVVERSFPHLHGLVIGGAT